MIETMEVNVVEVQGIWDEEDEILKNALAIWGILPKGITEGDGCNHKPTGDTKHGKA